MLHLPSQIIEASLRKNHHLEESKKECKEKLASSQDGASKSIPSSPVDLSLASFSSTSVTISDAGVGRSAQFKPTSMNGTRQLLRRWQRGHRNSPRLPPSRRSLSLSSRWETDLRYDSQQLLCTAWPQSVTWVPTKREMEESSLPVSVMDVGGPPPPLETTLACTKPQNARTLSSLLHLLPMMHCGRSCSSLLQCAPEDSGSEK
mmetsp:Transcript_22859/g.65973  ORF Transcript_22859/g.65973 Transcript_22859/m.65973 type:complete len:204 (+) Transcript_22859:3659-4270(+)